MHLTTDEIILYRHGFIVLNATLVYTWVVMLLLTVMSWLVTRNISLTHRRSRWQNALEVIVGVIRQPGPGDRRQGRRLLCSLRRHAVPLHRALQPARRRSRLACPHRIALHHHGPGHLRGGCTFPSWASASRDASAICAITFRPRWSCCRCTSSASFPEPWRSPCVCSAMS